MYVRAHRENFPVKIIVKITIIMRRIVSFRKMYNELYTYFVMIFNFTVEHKSNSILDNTIGR